MLVIRNPDTSSATWAEVVPLQADRGKTAPHARFGGVSIKPNAFHDVFPDRVASQLRRLGVGGEGTDRDRSGVLVDRHTRHLNDHMLVPADPNVAPLLEDLVALLLHGALRRPQAERLG